jgi:thiol:disulfide interchange protein DsbD
MLLRCVVALITFSSFVIRASSFAAPLSIELVSEVTSVQPGTPFYVGLHLKHQEHYHTYWKLPGIVGVPTNMEWKLPPGWKADSIEWPAPERVMMFRIKAQGYHGEVLLPIKLTPPPDLAPGTNVTLEGKATWMCCGLDCNPGFTDLSITLPVAEFPRPANATNEALFQKARANMPQALAGYDAKASREGDRVTLRVTPKEGIAPLAADMSGIFFTEDGYINADSPQVFRKDGESLVVELGVSTYFTDPAPADLRGILWLKDGALGKGAIIRASFAK